MHCKININSIPTIHGAIFPNTPKPSNINLGTDIKSEMIIWAEDCENLNSSILNLLELNQSNKEISDEEKKTIQRILYGDRLDNPFKEILKHGEHMQELEFDEDQRMLYDFMFSNKYLIIRGLAGTGKTILAAKKAVEESNNEKKVLVLTKTVGVGRFLSLLTRTKQFKRDFLEISSIDGFISNLARKIKLTLNHPQKLEDEEKDWLNISDEELLTSYVSDSGWKKYIADSNSLFKSLISANEESIKFKNWESGLSSKLKSLIFKLLFIDVKALSGPNDCK